ncbi:S9 family peptidase [Marinobacter confluentis]|uniref:S9 family peptidase n=1 Tax=Marinobacter confluentis TaxID=1697557 RepID=A0A4Z1BLL2_9GAMM|nr:S9 family peptidase [Marinobacter confluentis]
MVASRAGVYWLESDQVTGLNLIHALTGQDAEAAVAPAPLLNDLVGVRSNVNGYGGGALCVSPDTLYAVESTSQQILAIHPAAGTYDALTADSGACYGGLVWDEKGGRLLAVRESAGEQQLVCIERGQPRILHQGQDFYSAPAVSADGRQLAWVSWQLPDMPWVMSTLWLAEVSVDGSLVNARTIPTPEPACVQQPLFIDASVTVMSDHDGWWQPWQWSESGWRCLDPVSADGANAPWQLGESHHLALPGGGWLRVRFRQGIGELWWQGTADSEPARLAEAYVDFRCLRRCGDTLYCIARSTDRLDTVLQIQAGSGAVAAIAGGESAFGDIRLSVPEPFSLAPHPDESALISGFYYSPVTGAESNSQAESAQHPAPLVMIAHGGPTSMAYAAINPAIQFLCHQGLAVVEVNYRGSSGFGRSSRMALGGQWGVLDVQDMERVAAFLCSTGKAAEGRVAIQGRSAGGYTALMAMVTSDVFAAGVSQFGVSDPAGLRKLTHRFESGYLDWLLGPPDTPQASWQARSPLAQAHRIRRPMAFFQGGQDPVVVPEQTEAIARAIRENGQTPLVRLYPDEGHGFRKAGNQADMLRQLAVFYCKTLQ